MEKKIDSFFDKILEKGKNYDNLNYLLDDLQHLSTLVNEEINNDKGKPLSLAESSSKLLKQFQQGIKAGEIASGFKEYDKTYGGFNKGELVIFGGRPGMGKTTLFVQMALNMAQKYHVLFFSLDLTTDLLSLRFLRNLTAIPSNNFRIGKLSEEEQVLLQKSVQDLEQVSINIDDSPAHIYTLKEKCRKLHKEGRLDVVMVDYLQLVGGSSRRNSNRELEIALICRELKNIAKEFNVCVIAASQLSRAVETRGGDKRPQLSDLRESGAIEQDADKVIFVYRAEYYNIQEDENGNSLRNIMELIVAKNRNGSIGTEALRIDDEFSRLSDLERPLGFRDSIDVSRMNDFNDDDNPF